MADFTHGVIFVDELIALLAPSSDIFAIRGDMSLPSNQKKQIYIYMEGMGCELAEWLSSHSEGYMTGGVMVRCGDDYEVVAFGKPLPEGAEELQKRYASK